MTLSSPFPTINSSLISDYTAIGQQEILSGRVAVVIGAGGDGSRLGHNGPKGTYPLNEKFGSIFNVLFHKLASQTQTSIHLVLICSPTNYDATVAHVSSLPIAQAFTIHFIQQGMLPALSQDHTTLFDFNGDPVLAPSGNAEFYPSLVNSGVLNKLIDTGVTHLSYITVDNVSALALDPTPLGYAVANKLKVVNKVLRRTDPEEKVGVVVLRDGKPAVMEYSELSDIVKNDLVGFKWCNLGMHLFSVDFVQMVGKEEVMNQMPLHWANKKIEHWVNGVKTVEDGWKRERFIFDAFAWCDVSEYGVYEVGRDQFTPIKNDAKAAIEVLDGQVWVG